MTVRHAAAERIRGRPLTLVRTEDAANLYLSVHRGPTCVLYMGDPVVRRDPSRLSPDARHLISLARYVRYKAFASRLPDSSVTPDLAALFEEFAAWSAAIGCDGDNDARCLPFQTFAAKDTEYNLDVEADRQRFADAYGAGARRKDDEQIAWAVDHSHHGREPVRVHGRDLTQGFHWDLSKSRGFTIRNAHEVWSVDGDGHLNVYPNAHIRHGTRCRKLWPK